MVKRIYIVLRFEINFVAGRGMVSVVLRRMTGKRCSSSSHGSRGQHVCISSGCAQRRGVLLRHLMFDLLKKHQVHLAASFYVFEEHVVLQNEVLVQFVRVVKSVIASIKVAAEFVGHWWCRYQLAGQVSQFERFRFCVLGLDVFGELVAVCEHFLARGRRTGKQSGNETDRRYWH